ncbi:MBL fold metallo-hydrolase [uncultured Celeribacter sp.]|uniref:MBL fold metallo-hydrolase n=1 Tax=uncultured Celeribacter sp. TaxID=1303376 RepID=UPI002AA778DE|nr:MBL fold metallo-hydrolase [uncultured Celeribacter sp.]
MQTRPDTVPPLAPGLISDLIPGLIRILAPNPSLMTYWGTNSYLLGDGQTRVLIDPGPDLADHRAAILDALPPGTRLSHILVTHAHRDHSEGARALSDATGAPIYAFGDALAGRSPVMAAIGDQVGGGEGVDESFMPDVTLAHEAVIETEAGPITALHTPGHMGNHLCFHWQDMVFSGDLVMGWSSSLISPPDGDAAAFRDSCALLHDLAPGRLLPGHGAPIETPLERIDFLLTHRANREAQILEALRQGPLQLLPLTQAVYTELPTSHLPAASRNTLAHLIDLIQRNRIRATPELSENAFFSAA